MPNEKTQKTQESTEVLIKALSVAGQIQGIQVWMAEKVSNKLKKLQIKLGEKEQEVEQARIAIEELQANLIGQAMEKLGEKEINNAEGTPSLEEPKLASEAVEKLQDKMAEATEEPQIELSRKSLTESQLLPEVVEKIAGPTADIAENTVEMVGETVVS